ncbi:MAG TPA: OB-fold domain-containing protein [Acidimicrobiia bacterium]|nr:OB-fold domain-containing protein [Acidimicrobiia bacterium]
MIPAVQILAVGAAAPRYRLPTSDVDAAWGRKGGRGQAAVCAPDEDVLTLAAEAAHRTLEASGLQTDIVDGLWWGTARPPFAEGPSHAVLARAIGLSHRSGGILCAGSPHSGMEALLGAADAVGAGSARVALVVVSDALVPGLGSGFEARAGAGAAAIVLVSHGGTAQLTQRVSRTYAFLDRYRGDDETATRDLYDPRLFREEMFLPTVREVAEQLTGSGSSPRAWSLPDPDGRLGASVAKQLGIAGDDLASAAVYGELGDTGAAAALLGGIGSLAEVGTTMIVGFGGGRATGVEISVKTPVRGAAAVARTLAHGTPTAYATTIQSRRQLVPSGETVQMGVPPGSAQFVRGIDEMLGLLGARCVDCGTINTPPSIHPHCISCGSAKFVLEPLARRGTVHTFVVNQTMPAPFVAPLPIAVVDLEDGTRVMLQCVGDGDDIEIGADVELVLRRYAYERGVPVYGYKVRATGTTTKAAHDPSTERTS